LSQLVGPTDDNIIRTDSAVVANLTWYKTSGSSGAGPFSVTGFSATSSLTRQNANGLWSSEDTQNGGGANDGRTNASLGTTLVPSAAQPVPEPASVLSLGVGIIGLASRVRRFQRSRRSYGRPFRIHHEPAQGVQQDLLAAHARAASEVEPVSETA
jgi:hypothetical protein